jgi:hypothetical protein
MILCVLFTGGCVRLTGPSDLVHRFSQQRKLSEAVSYLEQGKTDPAVALLESIGAGPVVPGVSDEALFRLGLLHLGDGSEPGTLALANRDLERVTKEYPGSPWALISSNLSKALLATDGTRRQQRKLGDIKDSLSKNNRELKSSNYSLLQKNKDLKGAGLLLTEENRKLVEKINALTRETTELRQNIEQLKVLDLELEKKLKR